MSFFYVVLTTTTGETVHGFRNLYNGNIAAMVTSHSVDNKPFSRLGIYQYDELNRIRKTQNKVLGNTDLTDNKANSTASQPWANNAPWNEDFTYDANGNIKTLQRKDEVGSIMDNLTYQYQSSPNSVNLPSNRLGKVTDNVDKANFDDFKPGQSINNYNYDASGNLTSDVQERLDQIIWTPANKMEFLKKVVGGVTYYNYRVYDGIGQLVLKWGTKLDGTNEIAVSTDNSGEEYVRDPQGNVMATYQLNAAGARTLTEQTIYGSSRLGIFTSNTTILAGASDVLPTGPTIYSKYGNRKYEISNHLGNVLAVVSDEKDANGKAIVLDKQDYYAFGSPLPKNNEAAMVLFEGNYAQETTTNSNSGWIESNGNGILQTIAYTGLKFPINSDGKGARKAIDLLRDREYTFTANFSNLPSDITTYPITVEIINKANNEVLLQRTTTTSNIEFGFKAPMTGAAEVKIYLRNPVTGTVPEYNLTYAKLSKAAYIFPTSVPASEMEVVSNFNIGDRADQDLFDLPINNAGWLVNSTSSIIAVQEQVENRKIAVVNNSTTQTVTSISKTLTLGAGSYNLSFREFRQALSPYWSQLGSTDYPNTGSFSSNHTLTLTISGSNITTGAGSETYEIFGIEDIEQAFTLSQACAVTITITSNTKNLAFEYLTLTKTVPAATPETNSWASNYRYGFNGKEKENALYNSSNAYDFGARLYDSRLGRWFGIDALKEKYPSISPYSFVANNPFYYIDADGREIWIAFDVTNEDGSTTKQKVQYKEGKLYGPDGKKYTGGNKYALKVMEDLNQLTKDDKTLAERLTALEKSKQIHTIQMQDNPNKGNDNTPDSDSKDKEGIPTGSTTKYDPYKDTNIRGDKRVARAGLAHELLGHGYDSDQGKTDYSILQNGIRMYEVNALNMENRARAAAGDPKKTSYGGDPIPTECLNDTHKPNKP